MSRRRPGHALVQAVRAAGGSVRTVGGRVRVVLPPGVPHDDRPLLTLVLRQLMRGQPSTPRRWQRRGVP
jgi:hypothetical protein